MTLSYFEAAPTWGFLPVVPVMALTFLVYLVVHGLLLWREGLLRLGMPEWVSDPYVYLLLGVFLLSLDFWSWGSIHPRWAGIPLWLGYFAGLSILQTLLMIGMARHGRSIAG